MKRRAPQMVSLCMAAGMILSGAQGFPIMAAEAETETVTEAALETDSEADAATEAETETTAESDTAKAEETEAATEAESETETETEAESSVVGELIFAQCDDYINIRSEASTDSDVTAKIYNNGSATVVSVDGDWYEIQSGNATGYVKAEYFATGEEAAAIADKVAYNVATVHPDELNIRSEESTDSDVVEVAHANDELEVVAYDGDWMKVALGDDQYGYVNAFYVDYTTYYPTAETLEEEAARLSAAESASAEDTSAEMAAYAETEAVQTEAAQTESASTEAETVYTETEAASTEATYTETEPVYTETEPAYTETEPAYTETEPAYTETEPVYEETESAYTETEPVYEETEPAYTETEPVYEETEPAYTETEPVYEETEPAYTETEPVYEETEPAYTETEPVYEETESGSDSSVGQSIANYACQFIGNPYVYGGTSLTSGADCSGFVQSVFANYGIYLSRTADAQAGNGTSVSLDSLQPGDLLFYSSSGGYIDHVAIYIGSDTIVHAANSSRGIVTDYAFYQTPISAVRCW